MPNEFWHQALERSVVQRALKIALIVGTLLVLINHGPALLPGSTQTMEPTRMLQMLLTYLVPYGVSTYSSVMAARKR